MDVSLEGRVALVTGASRGIGRAIALSLAEAGADIAVNYRRDTGAAEETVAAVHALGRKAQAYSASVENWDEDEAMVAQVLADFGGIDILVNNAGIGAIGSVEDNDDDEWRHVLDVNVLGMVRTTRAALPWLRRAAAARGQAAIVNTCSVTATVGMPQRALYSASKGAVYSLTLAMAADYVAEGIRVNCVIPGTADTPWVGRLLDAAPDPAAERAALNARQPMGRLVTADEVAAAIAYLASPLASATTGTALAVDGGMQGLRTRPRTG
jgi:NAD(P)-dependent dehydrogenase (short-subunit alcohol dehydrogenase family)